MGLLRALVVSDEDNEESPYNIMSVVNRLAHAPDIMEELVLFPDPKTQPHTSILPSV